MAFHHTDIKASFENSKFFLQHDFIHDYLRELISNISMAALNKIVLEANRVENIKDIAGCGCVIRVTHGLLCAHDIVEYKRLNKSIHIDDVHRHWWKLGVDEHVEYSETQEKVLIKQHMVRLEQWAEHQNDETRREFLIKIDEFMNSGSTFLKEPAERAKTKGRPRVDTSTRRLPSAWEIDDVISQQDNNSIKSIVYEVGQDIPYGPIIHPNEKSIKPKITQNKVQSPQESMLTMKYNCQFRTEMQPYIIGAYDVDPDGNCGYRVVASAMGFSQKYWCRVRKDLVHEIDSMPEFYNKFFDVGEVKHIKATLEHYSSGVKILKYWMYFPEMGHLAATSYGVVVIVIAKEQCLTYLPLLEKNIKYLNNNELKDIRIGHVNDDHFVHLQMSPRHPLPTIAPGWENKAEDKVIHLYSKYQDRFGKYKNCCHIATIDSEPITLDD